MNVKIKWLREKIKSLDLQGMIITNPINVQYLTGIVAEGVLLLTRKETVYITDARYIEGVNRILTVDDEIIVYDSRDLSKEDYENFFLFCENVGFEENAITYAKYKECIHKYRINNFLETDSLIENQRMIKDKEEIALLQKACEITDSCFEHICDFIKIGQTEKEIAYEIEKYFQAAGAEGTSFDTIVASGANSSMPHAVPTDKKIEKGDVITIDFGCRYHGYCSDMTRTVFADFVPGSVKPIYDLVLKNQEQILSEIKEGANGRILTMMVESDFKINGYTLEHALGHGVGLVVHENPIIGRKDYLLKENMVVTDEPGIYIPGKFGVRIEDTVWVGKEMSVRLTKSMKKYRVVGKI